MSANNHKGGGGAALLLILAGVFLWPTLKPMTKVKVKTPAPQPAMIESTKFHVMRFYGASPKASRAVLEKEAEKAASKHGIDHRIFKALVRVESAWNPKAESHVGARGLAQILPSNAKRCGLPNADALWDVTNNVRCGAQILREEIDRLGNISDALTVYNCGRVNCGEGQKYAARVLLTSRIY